MLSIVLRQKHTFGIRRVTTCVDLATLAIVRNSKIRMSKYSVFAGIAVTFDITRCVQQDRVGQNVIQLHITNYD